MKLDSESRNKLVFLNGNKPRVIKALDSSIQFTFNFHTSSFGINLTFFIFSYVQSIQGKLGKTAKCKPAQCSETSVRGGKKYMGNNILTV